jgi:hypothetical protein
LAIGAPTDALPSNAKSAGAVYIFSSQENLGSQDLSYAGFMIEGDESHHNFGAALAFGETLSLDGGLLAVGAPVDPGYSLAEPGRVGLFTSDLASLEYFSNAEYIITGENNDDRAGFAIRAPGDIDGDGHSELLIGAEQIEEDGGLGAVYLLYGPITSDLSLSDAEYRLIASTKDRVGASMAVANDHDGDGYLDILIGAPSHSSVAQMAGSTHLLLGPRPTSERLADSYATYFGETSDEYSGVSVCGGGDVTAMDGMTS